MKTTIVPAALSRTRRYCQRLSSALGPLVLLAACSGSSSPDGATPQPTEPPQAQTNYPVLWHMTWNSDSPGNDGEWPVWDAANQAGITIPHGDVMRIRGANLPDGSYTLTSIDSVTLVQGVVDSVDLHENRLTLLGQALSFFEIYGDCEQCAQGLPPVQAGDFIRASGYVSSAGSIIATRIDHILPDSDELLLEGYVQELDDSASRFRLNDLTIEFGDARFEGFDVTEDTLGNGDYVMIKGSPGSTSAHMRAGFVSRRNPLIGVSPGEHVYISGLVTGFGSGAIFDVDGIPIDNVNDCQSNLEMPLQLQRPLNVQAELQTDGKLSAVACWLPSHPMSGRLEGPIDSIDHDSGKLQILGFNVQTRIATRMVQWNGAEPVPIELADLFPGQAVTVSGIFTLIESFDGEPLVQWLAMAERPDGDTVVAPWLQQVDEVALNTGSIRPPANAIAFEQPDLRVFGQVIHTDENTTYRETCLGEDRTEDRFFADMTGGNALGGFEIHQIRFYREADSSLVATAVEYGDWWWCEFG